MRTKLTTLIKTHEKIEQLILRAESLVRERRVVEARAALEAAVRILDRANGALRDLERTLAVQGQKAIPPGIRRYVERNKKSIARKGLSVVKVRIVRVRLYPDAVLATLEPEDGHDVVPGWFQSIVRRSPPFEVINAKILEVLTVGVRRGGLLVGAQRRRDLVPGNSIKLSHGPPIPENAFQKGQERWVVITPAFSHYIPNMLFGGGSTSTIVFTEPSRPRKRRRL